MGTDSTHLTQYFLDVKSVAEPTNDQLLNRLIPTSEFLRHQLEQYVSIQDQFMTIAFYEMYRTPVFGLEPSLTKMVGITSSIG